MVTRVAASVGAMKLAWVLFEGVTAWSLVQILTQCDCRAGGC